MSADRLWHTFTRFFRPQRPSMARPRKPTRLHVELLEDRTVPTIIYKPVFGAETTSQDDSEHGIQPKVYLTFWGSYWNFGIGATQIAPVKAAADTVLASTFPSIVN